MMIEEKPALIVHGHFYQPPRENPWTEVVEREPSASPAHDWNERVTRECYRPNAFAKITDAQSRVEDIVSNYRLMSFNFGPTLLSWLQRHDRRTYDRIIDGDRISARQRSGHGNAIAQGYNHSILPLLSERDRRTQVRWGLADFRHRFGREPESLWLPETACNDATLGTLIDEGLRFVILSPHQADRVRPLGTERWTGVADGSIDTSLPYRYFHRDGSGRSIVIFFYDPDVARAIAFDGALSSSPGLVDRFLHARGGAGPLVHAATDGESYGHHFGYGERCLAYTLHVEAPRRGFHVTNYGEFLELHPPAHEVEIKTGPNGEGTAWSCGHGLGRWCRDCGCSTGGHASWNQSWRAPLRAGLSLVQAAADRAFEELGGELLEQPWMVRDDYIELVLDRTRPPDEFLSGRARRRLREKDVVQAVRLLEMQRSAMRMFTSCGWFFAEISGIEAVQVMKYAAHVLDMIDELGIVAPRAELLARLGEARSNIAELGTGADIFRRWVEPCRVSPQRVAAHLAISGLQPAEQESGIIGAFSYRRESFQKQASGRLTLATGRLLIERQPTGEQYDYVHATLHFGGVDFYCALRPYPGAQRFRAAIEKLWACFFTASLPSILRLVQAELGPEEFGLDHLLPDGRQQISSTVLGGILDRLSDQYAHIYDEYDWVIEMLQSAGFEIPTELKRAAELTLGKRFEREIVTHAGAADPSAFDHAVEIADEVARRGYVIDRSAAVRVIGEMVTRAVDEAILDQSPARIGRAVALMGLRGKLAPDWPLDLVQESLFEVVRADPGAAARLRSLAEAVRLSPRVLELHAPPALEALPAAAVPPPAAAQTS